MHLNSSVSLPEPAGLLASHPLIIYISRVLPSSENRSHLQVGAHQSSPCLLNKIPSKAIFSHQQSKPHRSSPTSFSSAFGCRTFYLFQVFSWKLISGNQSYYASSPEMCPNHQKLNLITPFQNFTIQSVNPTMQIIPDSRSLEPMKRLTSLFLRFIQLSSFKSKVSTIDITSLSSQPFSFFLFWGLAFGHPNMSN